MLQYTTKDILFYDNVIVNAANRHLRRGGGVCGAIFAGAGPSLDLDCNDIIKRRKKPIKTGSAVTTLGYGVSDFIIHAVGPIYSNYTPEEARQLLAKTYLSIMKLAPKYCILHIPAISCGIYGFPIPDACSIAFNTVKHWQIMNWKTPINVLLNAYDPKVKAEYIKLGIDEYP